jgi:hypothetical protein
MSKIAYRRTSVDGIGTFYREADHPLWLVGQRESPMRWRRCSAADSFNLMFPLLPMTGRSAGALRQNTTTDNSARFPQNGRG